MCGIAGIINLSSRAPIEIDSLRRMAGALTHRGPDDEGYYLDPEGRCGLAFRRLAIIDLATGNQPASNHDGLVSVFNGEIYNHQELRAELAARGHTFRTRGDAEVIPHACAAFGADFAGRLHGMFAIALWDERAGTLRLVRDRFGQKPLTFAEHDGRLYFASEAKAILALDEIPRELEPQSLHRYLVLQYVPAPHSIYRGFGKLLPGHQVVATAGAGLGGQQAYYRIDREALNRRPATPDDLRQVGDALRTAVHDRLISDVPLGAFLSGGVDSSLVVALMGERDGPAPLTFSIGFDDPRYDESDYARRVAEHLGTRHHNQVVTPDAEAALETLAWHYDEPFADSSALPTYYVSRFARQHVTVALTGDAGDECFGGYDRYRAAELAARLDGLPRAVRRGLAGLAWLLPHGQARSLSSRMYRFLSAVGRQGGGRYLDWVNLFPPAMLPAAYAASFAEQLDLPEPVTWFEALHPEAGGVGRPAAAAMWADWHSYLPYDLLTKVDIASMAVGLECRAPFLDHRLVALASRLAYAGPGKPHLRAVGGGRLPAEVFDRPKMGFGVPVGEWFRGPLRRRLETELLDPAGICLRIFRASWLRDLLEGHTSGRANHAHRLWGLLMLALWDRRWLRGTDRGG